MMESSILKQITRFLQEQKKHKRWAVVFVCLAVIVGFGTVTALKMMGQAMTHKEKRLVCQYQVHQHGEECYDADKNLICGYADYVVHKHNDDCYREDDTLACTLPELEEHTHTDECWSEEQVLVCGQEESTGHQHTESCYIQQTGEAQCGLEEHQHTEGCYDAEGNLICGLEEHQHTEGCYPVENVLTCTIPEGEGAHTHTEACYEVQKTLVCDKPEVHLHTHTDECYEKIDPEKEYSEENRRLICGQLQVEEHVHTEDGGCLEVVEVNAVGEPVEDTPAEEKEVFTTDLNGENEEAEAEDEKNVENSGDAKAADKESEEEDDKEAKEEKTYELTKTYNGDGYTVTAEYNEDANIPEEAELIAEQITVDSDEEHYAKREAEYRKSTGDKNAVMKALFKVGFYVDGEEVEPETAVKLTIQLFDENGLPEGTPITVVHFAKKGTEVLDGSEAESGSTSFEMESFSDVAIGFKKADAKKASVAVSDSFQYKDEAFQITFHVEGRAKFEETADEGNAEEGSSDEIGSVEENDANTSEDSEEGMEDGADVFDDGASGDQESDSEQMITLPSVDEVGTDGAESGAEDGALKETGGDIGTKGLEFKVTPLEKGTPEYDAVVDCINDLNNGSELLLVRILSYDMYYNSKKLDLRECQVTAEIGPAEELSKKVEESMPKTISYLREEGGILDETEEQKVTDELQTEFAISALRMINDAEAVETKKVYIDEENASKGLKVILDDGIAMVSISGQPNPEFSVQYYANLDVVADSGTNALSIIDTSNKQLPRNGSGKVNSPNNNTIKNIYLDNDGNIQTTSKLTEVYSARDFTYIKAPTIKYMNALIENGNYELKEIWVLKSEKSETSTNPDDWDCYPYNDDLHFTNRAVSAEGNSQYILIENDTVLRFVYDVANKQADFNVAFYDYDITDGKIYKTAKEAWNQQNGVETSKQTNTSRWYANTVKKGINSNDNYLNSGAHFAFGNGASGTTLENVEWSNNGTNTLNKANDNSYAGCTFGLVTGLNPDGTIKFADNVSAPKLFNEKGSVIGKKAYDNQQYKLQFKHIGDQYTLSSVNKGTGENVLSNLEKFPFKKLKWGSTTDYLRSNNFWPLDNSESHGTDGHDLKFGQGSCANNRKWVKGEKDTDTQNFYESDFGADYNCNFGMYYQVEFELVADYVGPLEYYFFGDDDMWVFLGDELVCDIGGVHSSVGEYVNLWDYINKETEGIHRHTESCYNEKNELVCGYVDSKKYTLSFFYTERGESGSTCWMQFTLPSVSSLTPETTEEDYGHLRIEKNVTRVNDGKEEIVDNNDEFTFKVHFTKDGNNLRDDYSYVKYDKNGKEIGSDLIIWDGGEFTLKNGEYIIVKYLPVGTEYEVIETNGAITITDETKENSKIDYFTDITVDQKTPLTKPHTHNDTCYKNGKLDCSFSNVIHVHDENCKKDSEGNYSCGYVEAEDLCDDNKVALGTIPKANESKVTYNNKFYVYNLPKTGGSGPIIYTMAGVLVILIGAGFMYRKKVRERRV